VIAATDFFPELLDTSDEQLENYKHMRATYRFERGGQEYLNVTVRSRRSANRPIFRSTVPRK